MRYLIAPNAFKGTIEAGEAARIIAEEIGKFSGNECLLQPLADGGDGTCSLLIQSLGLEKINCLTLNAVGVPMLGFVGWDAESKKALIDVSTASGIGTLSVYQKDPYITSTYGTGLLIKKAVELGAEEIILGLGGSATVDMGIGILSALGLLFLDQNGKEIPLFSPNFLSKIKHIQKTPKIPNIKFTCLCDVRNLFFGPTGAVSVFGPQKGIKPEQITSFEVQCRLILELFVAKSKKEWKDLAGYGAAGGIALGLDFFFETQINFGAAYFFDQVNLKNKVIQADWIITGEGQYDTQSAQGKACFQLLQLAKSWKKQKENKTAVINSEEIELN
jgi:glycerate kinase